MAESFGLPQLLAGSKLVYHVTVMCSPHLCQGPDWSAHGLVGNPNESHGYLTAGHFQLLIGEAILLTEEGVHLGVEW